MIPDLTGVLAPDRTLPVVAPLAPLLPDGALTRGRTFACSGVAATSLSLSLVIIAISLAMLGRSRLSRAPYMPKSVATLKENAEWIRARTQS